MGRSARLNPAMIHVLLSLAEGPGHGYGLLKSIEARTDGALKLGASTLYYTIGRLEENGLVRETSVADNSDPHAESRRYFELTAQGRERLDRELADLSQLVEAGRRLGLGSAEAG